MTAVDFEESVGETLVKKKVEVETKRIDLQAFLHGARFSRSKGPGTETLLNGTPGIAETRISFPGDGNGFGGSLNSEVTWMASVQFSFLREPDLMDCISG